MSDETMSQETPEIETAETETAETETETAAKVAAAPEADPSTARASRKVREGIVVSAKMDKTVVVAVVDRVQHRRYRKTLQRTRRLYAHDEANEVRDGDRVRIVETRPMSRQKRWRVVEVLEHAR